MTDGSPEKLNRAESTDTSSVAKALEVIDRRTDENALEELAKAIDQSGEAGYLLAARNLIHDGTFPVQRLILNAGERWLSGESVKEILDMMPRSSEVAEEAGILLAKRWDVTGNAIREEFDSLFRRLKGIENSELETDEKRNRIVAVIREFDGVDRFRMLSVALGLAFVSPQETAHNDAMGLLKTIAENPDMKIVDGLTYINDGLREALPLSEGKSPYRFEVFDPKHPSEFPLPSDNIPGIKFPIQPEASRRELNTLWEMFSGRPLVNNMNLHRDVVPEEYLDPETNRKVRTILKPCDRATAEQEKRNFDLLASWGLPVPKVYQITDRGIRVEDLSENGEKVLVMDEFRKLGEAIHFAENEMTLQKELDAHLEILRQKGVDTTKLQCVLGVVFDKKTHGGKLFFVDVDHVNLPK